MSSMDDDSDWPVGVSKHGMEAERFRRWRDAHPGQPSSAYDRWDEPTSDPVPLDPLTRAEQLQAWKADQDDGFLTSREAANLRIGVAPPLTLARVLRIAPSAIGFCMAGGAFLAILSGAEMWPWPAGIGLSGLLVVLGSMFIAELRPGKRRFKSPKRRPRR